MEQFSPFNWKRIQKNIRYRHLKLNLVFVAKQKDNWKKQTCFREEREKKIDDPIVDEMC